MTTNNNQTAIKDILTSSPPGQFDQVLTSLRSIIPKSQEAQLLEPNFITALRSDWEISTCRSILTASSNGSGDETATTNDECVASLHKAMADYISLKFSSSGVQSAHKIVREIEGDTNSPISIATFAEKIDLHNHNSGSWTGHYTINPASNSLSGNVVICAHTFENGGNFQLHSNIPLEGVTIQSNQKDATKWAADTTNQILTWEDEQIMETLREMYVSMSSVHLKSLRRVMPITRTKMEWNVMAHRLVHTLGEGHGKDKDKS